MTRRSDAPVAMVLPLVEIQPLVSPATVAHVRGWFKMMRSQEDERAAISGVLGPLLLVGWLAIAAAFIYAAF